MLRALLLVLLALPLAAQTSPPDFFVELFDVRRTVRFDPRQQGSFLASAYNVGGPATEVRLRLSLPHDGRFLAVTADSEATTCSFTDTEALCTAARIERDKSIRANVTFEAPDRTAGRNFTIRGEVTSAEPDGRPHNNVLDQEKELVEQFTVTSTADSGDGSLRQRLDDVRARCTTEPCKIVFALDDGAVIRPLTPLRVEGYVTLEAKQRVILDGALQREGAALVLGDGCEIAVTGLTIRDFLGQAIEARRESAPVGCVNVVFYPHTYIADNELTGNLRGVFVEGTIGATIFRNTITGNRRSGIYVPRTTYAVINANRIVNNGNSGMYVAADADVIGNEIAGHPEWGIARLGGEIMISRNRIYDNVNPAIDYALDFETPNAEDDRRRIPNKPVLLSATYDATTNTTTVVGRVQSRLEGPTYGFTIELFASDTLGAHPEAERFVGRKERVFPGDFELAVEGDLTGQYVVATSTRTRVSGLARRGPWQPVTHDHNFAIPSDTSEMSNALPVTR